jgi:hypothetical protein
MKISLLLLTGEGFSVLKVVLVYSKI